MVIIIYQKSQKTQFERPLFPSVQSAQKSTAIFYISTQHSLVVPNLPLFHDIFHTRPRVLLFSPPNPTKSSHKRADFPEKIKNPSI